MSIRLENTTDGHSKFWCILLKGSETTVTYGKIGTKGRNHSVDHGSKEKAQKFYDKQIEDKKKDGYIDAAHPEGDLPSDSSEECHEPARKKAKKSSWDGTLNHGLKVFWMGGFNMQLSEKYFGVVNQHERVRHKVDVELEGLLIEIQTNWAEPTQVPKAKELKYMENSDIVVKGAWYTPGDVNSKSDEIRTMAAHALAAAEKMGCILVGEEAFYIAMVGKKD